jgi:diguanylate cyclase (GGDEF)-like protein
VFRKVHKWRNRITVRLYGAAVLSIVAVAILAIASFHFARITAAAAELLYRDGFEGINTSNQMQSLLERHRRIVESAPAQVDRKLLEVSQRSMIEVSSQLSSVIDKLTAKASASDRVAIEVIFSQKLPLLIERAQNVLFFATNFAQDKALDAAVEYSRTATELEGLIAEYRNRRIELAQGAVRRLSESARLLTFWVGLSALAAVILIGPVGLTITRGVLSRIVRITSYMTRLSTRTVTGEVPSRDDRDEVGDMARAVQVFKDNAGELEERKVQLELAYRHLDIALNNMTHGLCMFDAQQRLVICNGRYAAMYNLPSELTNPGATLHDVAKFLTGAGVKAISWLSWSGDPSSSVLQEMPDGRIILISRRSRSDSSWVAVHEDVTERSRSAARIEYLAKHDQLTGLPNRTFFHEELEYAVRRSPHSGHCALYCLDLDGFKRVNDSLGHPVGDELLRAVGVRLLECVRAGDIVGRLGGDEFGVIQAGITNPKDCSALATRIIDAVSRPYFVAGQHVVVSTCVGVIIALGNMNSADELMKNADLAMYRAKADGHGSFRLFEPEMEAFVKMRRALEVDLRKALAANELKVFYQPQVDTKLNQVIGMEALVRWFHPTRGTVPPSEFISLAEETGLICSLGEWVLRTACAEACNWPEHIRVAVNLSSVQVRIGNIAEVVLHALASTGLPATRLELEITESVILENDAQTKSVLNTIRGLGVRISMDDFGTGYSSLSYLRSFPLDKIKIDQTFIRDLTTGSEARAIVRAITSLANALGLGVIAEGVETIEQLEILQSEGCFEVQGYLFGVPCPAREFTGSVGPYRTGTSGVV